MRAAPPVSLFPSINHVPSLVNVCVNLQPLAALSSQAFLPPASFQLYLSSFSSFFLARPRTLHSLTERCVDVCVHGSHVWWQRSFHQVKSRRGGGLQFWGTEAALCYFFIYPFHLASLTLAWHCRLPDDQPGLEGYSRWVICDVNWTGVESRGPMALCTLLDIFCVRPVFPWG